LKVATNSRRHQSSDNFTSVGYDERLAVLDLTQDIAAVISELSMADRSHVANVARWGSLILGPQEEGRGAYWSRITHITAIPFPHQHTAVMIKRYGPIGALDRTRRETA
jgi:hypothetical protein